MSQSFTGQSVAAARRALAQVLQAGGIESPEIDARVLIGAVLQLDLTALFTSAERIITAEEAARLSAFAERRLTGEPCARMTGTREFWGLPFALSADTLIPRPDTETIVEAALDQLRGESLLKTPLLIADLGTGSGAILLALLSELPHATGIATDINIAALQTARSNAASLQLASRARFTLCNYADALAGGIDLIASNPPYIPSAEIAALEVEVRSHDPRRALDGGTDGLDAYRDIVPAAMRLLKPAGWLIVEVGHDQADDVCGIMKQAGLTLPVPPRADLSGIRRAVLGRKPA